MNPTTRRFPRTMQEAFPCDAQAAVALHSYPKPLTKRLFFALVRWGWVAGLLATVLLTGCNDLSVEAAQSQDLQDAQQQAAAEWRRIARNPDE